VRVQLNGHRNIRTAVYTLTAALLGSSVSAKSGHGRSETTLLVYSEKNGTRATECNFNLARQIGHKLSMGLGFTYDGLTGATPTGGSPSRKAQTLTRASGGATIFAPAGELPRDSHFGDTRFAFESQLTGQIGANATALVGAHASSEHDYTSVGLSAGTTRSITAWNAIIGFQLSYSHDVSSPVGGIPLPYAALDAPVETDQYGRKREGIPKDVYDLVAGIDKSVSPTSHLRLNYVFGQANGYQTDPYKIIDLVQAPDSAEPGEPLSVIHENRPDYRRKNALFGEWQQEIIGSPLTLSGRYFWDSWGIKSYTFAIQAIFNVGKSRSVTPHARWYRQTPANFYHPFLTQGTALPDFASADSRLGRFHALTYGLTYGWAAGTSSMLNVTVEYYLQRGDGSPPGAYGTLSDYNLFPNLNAFMLRLQLVHDF
jgi:hypothetical protein